MVPESFQIRDLTICAAAVLAPKASVTDTLFRHKFFLVDTVPS